MDFTVHTRNQRNLEFSTKMRRVSGADLDVTEERKFLFSWYRKGHIEHHDSIRVVHG